MTLYPLGMHYVSAAAVPWLRRLVVGLLLQRPEFGTGSVYVKFVVDKLALGQVSL
jgi:hypothetical protein